MKWERMDIIYMSEVHSAKVSPGVGGEIEGILYWCFKTWKLSGFLQIKAAINKPATERLWFTYPRRGAFQVLLSSSLLGARRLAVGPLLAANIKDAHTELISCGHLYNNPFAESQWCSFDLEQWPVLPFVWNMVIPPEWPLDVVHLKK